MKIKTVGLIWNPRRGGIEEAAARIATVCRAHGIKRVVTAPAIEGESRIEAISENELEAAADLVISIGGDGTLLGAARLLAGSRTPLWSVHTGSLGFLTEAMPSEIESALPAILQGHANVDEVELMTAVVETNGAPAVPALAFNEVAVESGGRGRMVSLAIEIDGIPVTTLDGNGVIVATPSGSTAYNLAAGGPIILPGLGVMVVTPICPHALSHRPIIVSNRSTVTIRPLSSSGDPHLIADGIVVSEHLGSESAVTVRASGRKTRMVRTSDRTSFDVLGEKLGWGDPRRRPGSSWGR